MPCIALHNTFTCLRDEIPRPGLYCRVIPGSSLLNLIARPIFLSRPGILISTLDTAQCESRQLRATGREGRGGWGKLEKLINIWDVTSVLMAPGSGAVREWKRSRSSTGVKGHDLMVAHAPAINEHSLGLFGPGKLWRDVSCMICSDVCVPSLALMSV